MGPSADLLADIQEVASLAALRHIYGDLPFPRDAVLERWRTTGALIIVDGEGRGFAAVDPPWLDALYVRPEAWGTGLAARLHDEALAALRRSGETTARLWVLEENPRARRFYERRGWAPNGVTRVVPHPPYPTDLQYVLYLPSRD